MAVRRAIRPGKAGRLSAYMRVLAQSKKPGTGRASSAQLSVVRRDKILVGVLAVPAENAQQAATDLADAGVTIICNYTQALLELPPQVRLLTSNPAAQQIAALALLG